MADVDLDAVGDFAQDLADRAVAIVRDLDPGPIQRKKDGTLVTEVDLAINSMVIEQVTQHWPEHGVLGEEESFQLGTDWLWVCDPLDGTFPFRVGIPAANFSLALCYRGAPQVAVIADPFANQRWFARAGCGCQYNGVPASVSDATSLATAGIDLELIGPAGAVLDALEDDGAHVLTMWAACAGGARVADGRLEALVYGPGQAWDVAAVALCVTEAGGRVSDMFGESVRFDGPVPLVVAAAPGVFDNLTTTLRRILG